MSSKQSAQDSQARKFIDAARELECDDDPDHFAETVRKIAKAKPSPETDKHRDQKLK